MNRQARVWVWFALFLTLAAGGLGWLTRKTLELDRAEAVARREAEQEERVRLALWRMDALLMPLLVQEASRPDFAYAPTHLVASVRGGKESQQRTLSPLVEAPVEFVRLHFQLSPEGACTSPQAPRGADREWSLERGVEERRIQEAEGRLAELGRLTDYATLLAQLPARAIESAPVAEANFNDYAANRGGAPQATVVESFAQQQLAQQAAAEPYPVQNFGSPANLPQTVNSFPGGNAGPGANSLGVGPNQTAGGATQNPSLNNFLANSANEPRATGGPASQNSSVPGNSATNRSQNARQSNADLSSRNSVYLAYASKVSNDLLKNPAAAALVVAPLAEEGVSRPLWVGGELLLARRVRRGAATYVQGCWLDWPVLRDRLRTEVVDVLPEVEVQPAGVVDAARSLATLPVQLVVPGAPGDPPTSSSIRGALTLAWLGLLVAAAAAAVTLASVLALSERRAAFVAAVTHELRTPLTTFRMYAEMLSGGMVPSERQSAYLETLRVEADRLAHLVDNVLQYARLERGRARANRETFEVETLVERLASRLAARAEQAELKLDVALAESVVGATMTVDAGALEQILFNLVDNACKYAAHGADRRLHLEVERNGGEILWRVRDHGPGLPEDGRRRLFQPFSKTVQEAAASAPGVGLGLALSHRLARELGGRLRLERSDADGTSFVVSLPP